MSSAFRYVQRTNGRRGGALSVQVQIFYNMYYNTAGVQQSHGGVREPVTAAGSDPKSPPVFQIQLLAPRRTRLTSFTTKVPSFTFLHFNQEQKAEQRSLFSEVLPRNQNVFRTGTEKLLVFTIRRRRETGSLAAKVPQASL